MKLTNQELLCINGGANYKAIFGIIGVVATFLIGLIDGYVHPKACSLKVKLK